MAYNPDLLFQEVIRLLHDNPSISLSDLSRMIGACPRTLESVIVRSTGRKFRNLRQKLLLEAACNLFSSKPASAIKEISFATGYRSARSFARAVKRACGLSPVALRARIINAPDWKWCDTFSEKRIKISVRDR